MCILKRSLLAAALILATVVPTKPTYSIVDFRPVMSLTQFLHENLIKLQVAIQNLFQSIAHQDQTDVQEIRSILNALHENFDAMNGSSRLHAIYRDDRDFLQSLIDRIDNMIADLEQRNMVPENIVQELQQEKKRLIELKFKIESQQASDNVEGIEIL